MADQSGFARDETTGALTTTTSAGTDWESGFARDETTGALLASGSYVPLALRT